MKRKFSKILGVGLSLVMVLALAVALAPVAVLADVTSATVTPSPTTTGEAAKYTITFTSASKIAGLTENITVDNVTGLAVAAGITLVSANATENITFLNADGVAAATTIYIDGATTGTAVAASANVSFVATTGKLIFTEKGTIKSAGNNITVSKKGTIYVDFPNDTTVPSPYTAEVAIAGDLGSISDNVGVIVGGITPTILPMVAERGVTLILPSAYSIKATNVTVTFYAESTTAPVTKGLKNPSLSSSYNLYVNTSAEPSLIKSAGYDISLSVVGVNLYDSSGNKRGSPASIASAISLAKSGDEIRLEEGTYEGSVDFTGLDSTVTSLTIKASGTAANTKIKGLVTINKPSITLQGVTMYKYQVLVASDDFAIKDCIFSGLDSGDAVAIKIAPTAEIIAGTISGCTFAEASNSGVTKFVEIDASSAYGVKGVTISGSTITGKGSSYSDLTALDIAGYSANYTAGATFKENTVTGVKYGVLLGNYLGTVSVKDNAITASKYGLSVNSGAAIASLTISGNEITGSSTMDVTLNAAATKQVIKYNEFSLTKALKNNTTAKIDATFNYWGSAEEPTVGSGETIYNLTTSETTYDPWLTDTAAAIFPAYKTAAGAATLDAKSTVGIKVDGATGATVISVAKYAANPQEVEPTYTALTDSFFDVYITGAASTAEVVIKFYNDAVTADTDAYVWSSLKNKWIVCSDQDASESGGYVWVKVTDETTPNLEALTELPFVLAAAPAAAEETFALTAPEAGATVPILTNIPFTWASMTDATSYNLVLSASADLSAPIRTATGVAGTAYTYNGTLTDGKAYYWQVTAMREDEVKGKSDVSTFIVQKPVVAAPPVVTVTPAPAPQVTVQAPPAPQVTVQAPPPAQITVQPAPVAPTPAAPVIPSYLLWAIIGIGAILVVALIVLIVRTRRVA